MKRSWIRAVCFLLILTLMRLGVLAETDGTAAQEFSATLLDGKTEVDASLLCDGQDDTVYAFKRGKPGTLTVTLPEGGEEALAAALCDATSAAVDVEVMESRFMGRRIR